MRPENAIQGIVGLVKLSYFPEGRFWTAIPVNVARLLISSLIRAFKIIDSD